MNKKKTLIDPNNPYTIVTPMTQKTKKKKPNIWGIIRSALASGQQSHEPQH